MRGNRNYLLIGGIAGGCLLLVAALCICLFLAGVIGSRDSSSGVTATPTAGTVLMPSQPTRAPISTSVRQPNTLPTVQLPVITFPTQAR